MIDFIDMEESRNDREVEKRLRDAVKNDRARVQIGKISQFGLMEMSRQRLRAGVVAGSTVTCPHCAGTGLVRSIESTALRVLRGLEEEGEKNRAAAVTVQIASDVAMYILNQKRHELLRIETEHGMEISFEPKEGMAAGSFEIERTRNREPGERPRNSAVSIEAGFVPSDEPEADYEEESEEEEEVLEQNEDTRVRRLPNLSPLSTANPAKLAVKTAAAAAAVADAVVDVIAIVAPNRAPTVSRLLRQRARFLPMMRKALPVRPWKLHRLMARMHRRPVRMANSPASVAAVAAAVVAVIASNAPSRKASSITRLVLLSRQTVSVRCPTKSTPRPGMRSMRLARPPRPSGR